MSKVSHVFMIFVFVAIFAIAGFLIYKHLFLPTMQSQGPAYSDEEIAQLNAPKQATAVPTAAPSEATQAENAAADSVEHAAANTFVATAAESAAEATAV